MQYPKQHLNDIFGEPIYDYSRAQAIEDGILVDVSKEANEAGFRIAVAMTAAAWIDCVVWNESDSRRQTLQDQAGRLWDVVCMAYQAARHAGNSQRIAFTVNRVPRDACSLSPRPTTLHMCIGRGDDAAPVITILLPNED